MRASQFLRKKYEYIVWFPWHNTDLDSTDASKSPQVAIADPRELCLDLLHELASDVETIVRAVKRLGLETHGSIVAVVMLDWESPDETVVLTFHPTWIPCRTCPTRARQAAREWDHTSRLKATIKPVSRC